LITGPPDDALLLKCDKHFELHAGEIEYSALHKTGSYLKLKHRSSSLNMKQMAKIFY